MALHYSGLGKSQGCSSKVYVRILLFVSSLFAFLTHNKQ